MALSVFPIERTPTASLKVWLLRHPLEFGIVARIWRWLIVLQTR